jgi:hypothetical protein
MEPTQGAILDPASAVPGQGADPGASAVVDPNTPPASADPSQGADPVSVEQQLRTTQGAVDGLRAQLLQQQQMMAQMMQPREPQQPQSQTAQNPHPPGTQEWWQAEIRMGQEVAAQKATQGFMNMLAQASQQQAETQWQMQHPEIPLVSVKMWAQQNMGFEPQTPQALDRVYTLMTLPANMQTVQTGAVDRFYTQARQPANTATPLRGSPAPAAPGKVSFEALAKAWNENPAIEKTWSPELRQAWEQELQLRDQLQRQGKL